MGSKGINAAKHLRGRSRDRRGGNPRQALLFDRSHPENMADYADSYLEWLEVRNYTTDTIEGRRYALDVFLEWCQGRDLIRAADVTKPILESYQRFLHRYRKKSGKPLGFSTQRGRISALKDFFRWLCRSNHILYNPASELEMPRPEKRLPEEPLSVSQVETILGQPDLDEDTASSRARAESWRDVGLGAQILRDLSITSIRLIASRSRHYVGLSGFDIEIADTIILDT